MSQSAIGPRNPQVIANATGLIKYLRDVVRSSRRVVRDSAKFEDLVWLCAFPEELVNVPDAGAGAPDSPRVLSVTYEPKLPAPRMPRILEGWLDTAAIHDPFGAEPTLRPPSAPSGGTADRGSTSGPVALEERSSSQQVHDAYAAWIGDWRVWSEQRREVEPRQQLYDRLARIAHAVSDHDDVLEAVLAAGLLVWEPKLGKRIHRHLVTRRLRISIDGPSARIDVRLDQDAALQLEDQDFLNEEDGYRRERAAALHDRISDCPQNPLHEDVGELVGDWSRLVFDEPVRYSAQWRTPDTAPSDAGLRQITMSPAVILRKRDRSAVVDVYERALARLSSDDAEVPLNFAHLIAPLTKDERFAWTAGHRQRWTAALEEDPLFPLATNPRQRDVLDLLRHNTAAVVQGPPGTGKTRTIANLTSAFLAQGLRVLVTSQKEQALAVLREMVPPQVRDLCVMLGSGDRSNALEHTLTALSDRAASAYSEDLEATIRDLADRRTELLRRRAELENDVQSAREAEALVRELAPGYKGTLAVISSLVAQDSQRHGWMPTPPDDAPPEFPLGVGLFCQLRDLLRAMTPERSARTRQCFPEPAAVLGPAAFAELGASVENSQAATADLNPVGEAAASLSLPALAEIQSLLQEAANCLHRL